MKMRNEYTCPLEMTHDIMKGKWKPMILWQLYKGSCSLILLKSSIRGVSQKMLIQHLNDLVEYGIINKTKFQGYPLQSEYALSELGKRMFEAICIMQEIGIEIMKEDHREAFLEEQGFL